jgi:glyoxylase-like metal-dependent hydrolase (beta-lactamase superfamily II)
MFASKVSERVYLLDTYAFGFAGSVGAYLIKGPKPTLLDCGYASSYENVLAGLAEVGVMPTDVRYVIPTHVHLDHAGAAGRLLREMPNAQVIAHEKSVKHLVDPTKLMESVTKVFGETLASLYGTPEPISAERITAVGEEMPLDLGGGLTATIIHSPGHAPHQISMVLDGTKALLTADAVGIVYPWLKVMIPTTPPPSFNPDDLLASLRKLRQTTPGELLVPHFGTRKDVDSVFDNTAHRVADWVEKVRAMGKKGMTLDEISEVMEKEVEAEAGVGNLEIYAKISIRTSVMGIMHFLSKNP